MINNIILGIVRVFIERQILKFGKAIDWTMVKADIAPRLCKLVPGDYYDATAVVIVSTLIDLVATYFASCPIPDAPGGDIGKLVDEAFTSAQNNILRELASKIK